MSLTVFANFYINDENRFKRMKESFFSFCDGNIDYWLINVRGKFSKETSKFLLENISNHKIHISFINSEKGWFEDSKQIINKINTTYVFVWNEDHKNMRSTNDFNIILNEIKKYKVENFTYSLFYRGDLYKSLLIDDAKSSEHIIYIDNTEKIHKKRLELIKKNKILGQKFIISLVSILSTKLFKKIIFANDPPIKRWSKYTPFNFEKTDKDVHWLPFRFGVPKNEFFKCIDKDWDAQGNRINYTDMQTKNNKFYLIKFIYNKIKVSLRELVNKIISRYILKI